MSNGNGGNGHGNGNHDEKGLGPRYWLLTAVLMLVAIGLIAIDHQYNKKHPLPLSSNNAQSRVVISADSNSVVVTLTNVDSVEIRQNVPNPPRQ